MTKKLLFIIPVLIFVSFNHGISQEIISEKKLNHTDLENGLQYGPFTVNDNYLVWGEFYTQSISIYDLETEKLNKLKLTKGRGPHEYQIFTSLSLTERNHLVIADPENIKLIVYDIGAGEFLEDKVFSNFLPYKLNAESNFFFGLDRSFSENSLFYILKNKGGDIQHIPIDMLSFDTHNEFAYPFRRDGVIASNDSFGVFFPRYYPDLYISNLKEKKFVGEISYDEWYTEKGEQGTIRGKEAYFAPTNVDVTIKAATFMPASKYSIMVLARGEGEERSYKFNRLRIFDIQKEKFTGDLAFDFEVTNIATNSEFLFVYSKEENAIFKYQIDPGKKD